MHRNALELMGWFIQRYLPDKPLKILDLGSRVVDHQERLGSHRQFCGNVAWQYIGSDIEPGNNVDLLADAYKLPFANGGVDVVLSSQMLEHVEYPWLIFEEIARVLKPGGLCCVIAPAKAPRHNYPLDCYRFNPHGMIALAKWGRLTTLKARTKRADRIIRDCYLVARK